MLLQVLQKLKSDDVPTVLEAVSKVGAMYSSPMQAFDDYSITSGRIITGTNPASGAEKVETLCRVIGMMPVQHEPPPPTNWQASEYCATVKLTDTLVPQCGHRQ